MGNINNKPNGSCNPHNYNKQEMNEQGITKLMLCDDVISNDIMSDDDMVISSIEFCKKIFQKKNSYNFPTLYKMCVQLHSTLTTNVNYKEIFKIGLKWEYLLLEILFGHVRRHYYSNCITQLIKNHNRYLKLTKKCLYDSIAFGNNIYSKRTYNILYQEYGYIKLLSVNRINILLEEIIRYEFDYDSKKYPHISLSTSNDGMDEDCLILNKVVVVVDPMKCRCKCTSPSISTETSHVVTHVVSHVI